MKSVHGVLNIKPISSLMKCKYYRESLNWNTERKGAKGGSDSLFQVFTFIDSRDLGRGAEGVKEKKFRQKKRVQLFKHLPTGPTQVQEIL